MNLLIWIATGIALGGIIGYFATSDRLEYLLNVVSGIVGAVLGGCVLAPMFGTGAIDINKFSSGKLIAAIVGASILLALINLAHAKNGVDRTD
ncbi:MAG TPA: GlsB/YeaQ/YmgE family stress response membrane protein [Oxalicibacterium sp.]|uniref:GlsB/YeaQ/YmgE family stress response membrane protein n=1 Tax=Oxalicibacterium sp. TaxID=2766525 RepID=UPI002CC85A9D|nr:GlsB/YeaQ/YmgE family stress response membrane protein [Oxalicibacterium sp.]HWU96902.1 GlsB/YeaQ/YmgE family stress response membrane protein [Oxalicibacterium sp.]